MTFKEVHSIGKVDAYDLERRALKGDAQAAVTFVWYSVWKGIKQNPVLTKMERVRVFNLLLKTVKLQANLNG